MNRKILVLDVETKPTLAYVWRAWDENVAPDQVVEHGGIICWAAKWVGKKEMFFAADWVVGRRQMLQELADMLAEADAVITFNGDKFDLPKIIGEMLLEGMDPPAPPTSIDVIKTIKKMGFLMNRLAYVGPLLGVGDKIKHEGFNLWRRVMAGDAAAQGKMRRYNIQDVKLLEQLYKRILPFIRNHPHLGQDKHECGSCGSNNTQNRGFRRTKFFRIQRIQCNDCGSWSEGARQKI